MSIFKKNNENNFWKTGLGVFILLVLIFLLFWKAIFNQNYISFGDNTFLFEKLVVSAWLPYENNGVPGDLLVSTYLHETTFLKVFMFLGIGPSFVSKMTYFLPIFFALLASYILLRKVSNSTLYALIGSSVFILSVTSVEYMTVSFIRYFEHVASIFILTYLIHSWGFKQVKINYKRMLALVVLSFFNLHPFYFIIYNLYLFLYLFYISLKNLKLSTIIKHSSIFVLILFSHLIWLLPFITNILISKNSPAALYGESNWNAVLSGYISQSSLTRIMVGSVYPISGYWENLVNVSLIGASFILLLVFLYVTVYFLGRKNEKVTFFSVIFIIFLSLSFWPNNPILGSTWDYLLKNFSFFGFFRSFNRFITVLLPVMFVVIGMYYKEHKNWVFKIVLISIFLLTLFGRINLMTGDLGGIIPVYKIPTEYAKLNESLKRYKSEVGETPRVLTYPKTDYEAFVWNKNSNYNNIRAIFNLLNNYLDAEILTSKYGNHVFISEDFFKNIFDYKYCLNNENYLEDLRKIDIDYVLLNKDLITRKGEIVSYDNCSDCLKKSNFTLEMSNDYFDLYKIDYGEDYQKNYKIKEIYPFYYQVDFDFKGSNNAELIFPQNFNPEWKLYFDSGEGLGFLEKIAIPFYNKEIQVQHINNEPGNKWVINRNDFDDDNVTLHLYYYPQIYVVIGFIVSSVSIIALFSVGVVLEIKNIKRRK